MALAYYLANELLDAYLLQLTFAAAACYSSLHTADPGITGASECTGGSYARQDTAFSAASDGASANTAQEEFTSMPACSITHVGLWDALSASNFMQAGAITGGSKTVNAGDTVRIAIGDLDVTLT
jgi:hypothetical protein